MPSKTPEEQIAIMRDKLEWFELRTLRYFKEIAQLNRVVQKRNRTIKRLKEKMKEEGNDK